MGELPEATQDYLVNGTPKGQRNQRLFDAACQFRDAGFSAMETEQKLLSCALRDGLPAGEAAQTLRSVFARSAREELKPRNGNGRTPVAYTIRGPRSELRFVPKGPGVSPPPEPPSAKDIEMPRGRYQPGRPDLPEPMADGARALLKAAFREGEGVRIALGALGEDGRDHPKDAGATLGRDDWLKKLSEYEGAPNGLLRSSDRAGIFIAINPLKAGCARDADVTAFRHALLEFDGRDMREQWDLIRQSKVPCAAVLTSGGRSVHAWVRVEASDRDQYRQRVRMLFQHFAGCGVDEKNNNPGRLSRLPNCERLDKRQVLLALNVGAASWEAWTADVQGEEIGERMDLEALAAFDPENDPNTVLGDRWLCRGGSCLFVGQSGIGKSSLAMQMAIHWALGRGVFGIQPAKALKSLIIQAENDMGDVSEMVQGSLAGAGIKRGDEAFAALKERLVIVTDTVHTGQKFCEAVKKLVLRHQPDLVWFDPLLSFIGDDISQQKVCSEFLRNWLNPISHETGVVWMMVHHTNKPLADPKSKSHWNSADHSYSGTGSSELTNWARAVCLLRQVDEARFELMLTKRGGRAGARDLVGGRTNTLHLAHAEEGILWQQVDAPEPRFAAPKKGGKTKEEISKIRSAAAGKELVDFEGLITKVRTPMTKQEIIQMAINGGHGSKYLVKTKWGQIEAALSVDSYGYFVNPNSGKIG